MAKKTFEEMLSVINSEIQKRRKKWVLSSISYMDFDDVSQILLLHIHRKWHLWDQTLPLENWLAGLIKNHIFNLIRDNYGIYAPPCNNCQFNMSGDGCSLNESGVKSNECRAYAVWSVKKRDAYNLKLASNIDQPLIKVALNYEPEHFDIDLEEAQIHKYMEKNLDPNDFYIYDSIIIKKHSVNKFMSSNKRFLSQCNMVQSDIHEKIQGFKTMVKVYIREHV